MAAEKEEQHRPGAFKQQNKTHKTGRHRSKGQLDKDTKGRVNVKSLSGRSAKKALNRQQRRNQALQIRKQKRDEILNKKRSRGGSGSPPFLVTVVCLCDGVDTGALLKLLQTCDDTAVVRQNDLNICHIGVPRFKQRFEFVCPDYGNLYALLDAVKVADCLLFVLKPHDSISSYGELCLSTVFAQGLPASVLAIQGLKEFSVKKQSEMRHSLQKRLEKRFPQEKLHMVDTSQDALVLLRTIGNQKLQSVAFRDQRPHIMAEDINFELTDDQSTTGTLRMTGYLRGRALSVNGLVHLPGWGDFQMSQIDAAHDPNPLTAGGREGKKKGKCLDSMEVEMEETGGRLLERADPGKQESLQSEVVPDPMEGEQTWPTEEELALAQRAATEKKKLKKLVPKGTSEYQAAWIIEDEEEDEDSDGEEEDEEMAEVGEDGSSSEGAEETDEEEEEEELDTISFSESGNTVKYDATIDMDEERRFLEKLQQARTDQMFPDEIDTPCDVSARVRFQRYRGLKSFRTSPWDPKEIFRTNMLKSFSLGTFDELVGEFLQKRTKMEPSLVGTSRFTYKMFQGSSWSYSPGHPVVIFGLLPHEQKMSVVNMMVRPVGGTQSLLKSKERVIFHVGCRRFAASPVYSEHTNGDKYKYERFLQQATVVATVYAPITFPPAGVLMFKEKTNGEHELVATGCLLSVNPDRVIIKRIVLSGHPFKINAKSATVRYMFYTREDIAWFTPVELRTKWGRRGHIKESLGTHGHMKCVFDGQLKSQDTILMNLYKRVFPKWTYEGIVHTPLSSTSSLHSSTSALQDIAMNELFD